VETRMTRLRARWLVLLLGGILLATTVLVGGAGDAEAQSQGKGQGQAKGQTQGGDEAEDADEAEGGGGQEKVTLCHKGKTTITVGAPAVKAHEAHADTKGACQGLTPPTPPLPPGGCELPDTLGFVSQNEQGNDELVDEGDEYLLDGENLTLSENENPTITVEDAGGTSYTFDNTTATFTEAAGGIRVVVELSAPADLEAGAALTVDVESAQGIECGEIAVTGTLATTRSGDVALRTTDGKGEPEVLPLVAETPSQQERLEELAARKLGQVKVTGVKDKKLKVEGQKAKQDRKAALKVTSIKKTEVQKKTRK
jgi:hypothetical protein